MYYTILYHVAGARRSEDGGRDVIVYDIIVGHSMLYGYNALDYSMVCHSMI